MGSLIAFVGWNRSSRQDLSLAVPVDWSRFVAPEEFRQASWKPYKGAVLGDQALRTLTPDSLQERLASERLRMLLCPVTVAGPCVGAWEESGLGRLVRYERLRSEVLRTMPYFERPFYTVDDVFDPMEFEIGPDGRDAFLALHGLPRPTANAWAAELGITRHALRRLCLNSFGVPSELVLWIWIARGVQDVRRSSATLEDAAHVYGYANAGSLHRAFKRRGMDVPGRGPQLPGS